MTSLEAADLYAERLTTAEKAIAGIADGETVSAGMAIGQPPALLAALANRLRTNDLKSIRFYYKIAMEPLANSLLAEDVLEKIDAHSFFVGGPDHAIIKRQVKAGRKLMSFVPVHFSQIPRLFEEIIRLDTFVVTVSPMDKAGFFSLGTNNDFSSVAARRAKRLIVEVNRHMPRIFGQSSIHVSEVSAIIENHLPLIEAGVAEATPEGKAIGDLVAPMVPNGATIQLGIGKIPSGVALALRKHADLGIHTELFSPAMADLIRRGVINGSRKTLHPHKHVFTVAFGTTDSYAFMNDNPAFESYPSSYVNDIRTIAAHDDFISINTAIEIDLYGQVNAEFIGEHEYSGSGGQFDFVKGASLAKRGKSIIALQSTAKKGTVSSIVPKVSMVTDVRMDVEWVVTEHGAVNLRGKSTKERADALIGIAHPDFRAELAAAARAVTLI
ncbi:acetyl-CoA hydrolase/transferase C-terminal domain-containing protein [uncultured Bradyrhizobium sp.]|uniref:acetyl-CoA hydrolase/transferase family protein n=1 Tax=Bradyrhizobium sp. TaxID=376 RepID=UPI002610138B|nr:acetyl-CoA hydrolase/transferase C-terminal domain-containing protein [uncultured Bradyrhizobium sp.]